VQVFGRGNTGRTAADDNDFDITLRHCTSIRGALFKTKKLKTRN
jgi:hypothetical protein